MKLQAPLASLAILLIGSGAAAWNMLDLRVSPRTFDPARTFLVSSHWIDGIGCPTDARVFNGTSVSTFTAGGCPTGDRNDFVNEGLLLAKTGPTSNEAAAIANIYGVWGVRLQVLGYDIRKVGPTPADPRGSHCGAGAPRFNITTDDDRIFFIGCNSPAPVVQHVGNGWMRLRWGLGAAPLQAFSQQTGNLVDISGRRIKRLQIVFDEGQDTGPDFFGMAVLDNIDVNGTLVGHGPYGYGARSDEGDSDAQSLIEEEDAQSLVEEEDAESLVEDGNLVDVE